MSRIRLKVATDALTAEVEVVPGTAQDREQFERLLGEAGVTHGIDTAMVAELGTRLQDTEYKFRGVIARGTLPEPGRDGELEMLQKLDLQPGTVAGDGSIDWRERGLLLGVVEGEVVARWRAPEPGRPGTNVRGKTAVPPPVKDNPPRLGEGLRLESDGRIVARRDGVLHFVPGKVFDAVELWRHQGNVDVASGNLHARGCLVVTGDVGEGGVAEATGDILVQGSVYSGAVLAGGHVVLQQGIMGSGSEACAGGDLTCRHATGATLTAGATVLVQGDAVHCCVRGDRIDLTKGRGRALGGELRARLLIALKQAGSDAAAETLLSVADLSDEFADLASRNRERNQFERAAKKAQRSGERGKGGKLGIGLCKAEAGTEADRIDLKRRQRELLATARIEVRETAYPGVTIQFGAESRRLTKPIAGVAFRFDPETSTIIEEPL